MATLVGTALAAFGMQGLGREGLWPVSNPSPDDTGDATTLGTAEATFSKATALSFSATSDDYKQGADWMDQAAEPPTPPKPDDDGEATVEDEAEPTQEPEHEAESKEPVKVARHRRSVDNNKPLGLFEKPAVIYIKNKGGFNGWGHLFCKKVPASTADKLKFSYNPSFGTESVSFWTKTITWGSWNILQIPAGSSECSFTAQVNTWRIPYILNPNSTEIPIFDLGTGYQFMEYHMWGSVLGANGGFQDPRLTPNDYDWAKKMFKVSPTGCITWEKSYVCRTPFPLPQQYVLKDQCFNPAMAKLKSKGQINQNDNCGMDIKNCESENGEIHDIYMHYGRTGLAYGCKEMSVREDEDSSYRYTDWKYTF